MCTERSVIPHLAHKRGFKPVALETGLPFLHITYTGLNFSDKIKHGTEFLLCQHLECAFKDNCNAAFNHRVFRAQRCLKLSSPFILEDLGGSVSIKYKNTTSVTTLPIGIHQQV